MKPLPEAVQSAFPCAPGCLPERPWWRRAGGQFLRDGMGGLWRPLNDVLLEDYDAKNPLPHPGYRAGQVWAAEIGSSRTLLAVSPRGTMVTLVKMIMDPESEPRTSTLDCEELHEAYPYLMADPACPHLAPWSPAEVKS